jgi:hypothetical protein
VDHLRWFAAEGVVYQVRKKHVADPNWSDFGAPFTGQGLVTNIMDEVAPDALYRVIVVE